MEIWENVSSIFVPFILICLTLIALVGNIIVVVSVKKFTHLNTQFCFHILAGLAFADICVAVLVMPWSIVSYTLGYWPFGYHLCKAWMSSDVMCCTASILHLCMVALDRYLAIAYPFRYSVIINASRIRLGMVMIWLASALISFIPIHLNWYQKSELLHLLTTNSSINNEMTDFQCMLKVNWIYALISSSTSFYIPLILVCIVYGKIFWIARTHAIQVQRISINLKFNQPNAKTKHLSLINNSNSKLDIALIKSIENQRFSLINRSFIDNNTINNINNNNNNNNNNNEQYKNTIKFIKKLSMKRKFSNLLDYLSNPIKPKIPNKNLQNAPFWSGCSTDQFGHKITQSKSNLLISSTNHTLMTNCLDENPKSSNRNSISWKNEMKAIKTIGLLVGCFILCWLPFFVIYLVEPFCSMTNCQLSIPIIYFITWIGYINSVINPILYGFLQRDFRHAFHRPFRRLNQHKFKL